MFAILVADLDGDAYGAQKCQVLECLRTQFAEAIKCYDLQVRASFKTLRLLAGGIEADEIAAQERGRAWLKKHNADVLIWGEVAQDCKIVRLHFLRREGATASAEHYEPGATLELPCGFGTDLGALIAGQAAAAIIRERAHETRAEFIDPFVAKVKPLAENPPASLISDARAQLWYAYALGEYRLGEERGDTARLESAIAYFRKALTQWTRERLPLEWAAAQNNLGNALRSLGERESGTALLEEAVTAFREALKERTRERMPLDWAAAQNNLGNALRSLGERESGTALLEEAVAAFREALKERTRERMPLDWAMTQNNLGAALASLGEREAAVDKAKGRAALLAARGHFAAALEEFRKAGASYYAGMVEGNIAKLGAVIARLCG